MSSLQNVINTAQHKFQIYRETLLNYFKATELSTLQFKTNMPRLVRNIIFVNEMLTSLFCPPNMPIMLAVFAVKMMEGM